MTAKLWVKTSTDKAVLYCRRPPHQASGPQHQLWIPRSLIEHTLKFNDGEHHVTIPDWFSEKYNLTENALK